MKEINIEELKKIQLEILLHVDKFCKEHNIRYFLCAGTLLGAIRHKGYIPWDDDIDIMLFREDYNRLIDIFLESDNGQYRLHTYKKEKEFPYPFVKIDDSRTSLRETVEGDFEMGVNIDVFPIDTVPQNGLLQKLFYTKCGIVLNALMLKRISLQFDRGLLKNFIIKIFHRIFKGISCYYFVRTLDRLAQSYSQKKSEYCGLACWGYGMREMNLRSNFDEVIYVSFEGHSLPAPKGYNNYLSAVYGDYMQMPPEDKRVTHHAFEAFWK